MTWCHLEVIFILVPDSAWSECESACTYHNSHVSYLSSRSRSFQRWPDLSLLCDLTLALRQCNPGYLWKRDTASWTTLFLHYHCMQPLSKAFIPFFSFCLFSFLSSCFLFYYFFFHFLSVCYIPPFVIRSSSDFLILFFVLAACFADPKPLLAQMFNSCHLMVLLATAEVWMYNYTH